MVWGAAGGLVPSCLGHSQPSTGWDLRPPQLEALPQTPWGSGLGVGVPALCRALGLGCLLAGCKGSRGSQEQPKLSVARIQAPGREKGQDCLASSSCWLACSELGANTGSYSGTAEPEDHMPHLLRGLGQGEGSSGTVGEVEETLPTALGTCDGCTQGLCRNQGGQGPEAGGKQGQVLLGRCLRPEDRGPAAGLELA